MQAIRRFSTNVAEQLNFYVYLYIDHRTGRILTDEDIDHYQRIVVALSETIRIMAEIDKVIETHGGWPDAFVTAKSEEES